MQIYYRKIQYEVKPNIDIMIGTALVVTQFALRMILLYTQTKGRLGRRYLPNTECRLQAVQNTILVGTNTNIKVDEDDSQFNDAECISDDTVNQALDVIEAITLVKDRDKPLLQQRKEAGGFGREIIRPKVSNRRRETTPTGRSDRQRGQRPQTSRYQRTTGNAGRATPSTSYRRDTSRQGNVKSRFGTVPKQRYRPPVKTVGAVRMARKSRSDVEEEATKATDSGSENDTDNVLTASKSSSTGKLVAAAMAEVADKISAAILKSKSKSKSKGSISTVALSSSEADSLNRLFRGRTGPRWYHTPQEQRDSKEEEKYLKKQHRTTVASMSQWKPSSSLEDIKRISVESKEEDYPRSSVESKEEDYPRISVESKEDDVVSPTPSIETPPTPIIQMESTSSEKRLRKPGMTSCENKEISEQETSKVSPKSAIVKRPGKESVISYTPLQSYQDKDEGLVLASKIPKVPSARNFMSLVPPDNNKITESKQTEDTIKDQLPFSPVSHRTLPTVSSNIQRHFLTPQLTSTEGSSQFFNTPTAYDEERPQPTYPQGGGGSLMRSDEIMGSTLPMKRKDRIYYNRLISPYGGSGLSSSLPSRESIISSPIDSDKSTVTLTQSGKSSLTISNTGDSVLRFTQTDESLLSFEQGANSFFTVQESGMSFLSADQSGISSITTENSGSRSLSFGDSGVFFQTSTPLPGQGFLNVDHTRQPFSPKRDEVDAMQERQAKRYTISTAKANNVTATLGQGARNVEKEEQKPHKSHSSKKNSKEIVLNSKDVRSGPFTKDDLQSDQNRYKKDNEIKPISKEMYLLKGGISPKSSVGEAGVETKPRTSSYHSNGFPATIPGIPSMKRFLPGLIPATQEKLNLLDGSSSSLSSDKQKSNENLLNGSVTGTRTFRHSYPTSNPSTSDSTGRSSLPEPLSRTEYGGAPLIGKEPFPRKSLGNVLSNKDDVQGLEKKLRKDSVSSLGSGLTRLSIKPFQADQSIPSSTQSGRMEPKVSSRRISTGIGLAGLGLTARGSIPEVSESSPGSAVLNGTPRDGYFTGFALLSATSLKPFVGKESAVMPRNYPFSKTSSIEADPLVFNASQSSGQSLSEIVNSMGLFCSLTGLRRVKQSDSVSFSRKENGSNKSSEVRNIESNKQFSFVGVGSISNTGSGKTSLLFGSQSTENRGVNREKSPAIISRQGKGKPISNLSLHSERGKGSINLAIEKKSMPFSSGRLEDSSSSAQTIINMEPNRRNKVLRRRKHKHYASTSDTSTGSTDTTLEEFANALEKSKDIGETTEKNKLPISVVQASEIVSDLASKSDSHSSYARLSAKWNEESKKKSQKEGLANDMGIDQNKLLQLQVAGPSNQKGQDQVVANKQYSHERRISQNGLKSLGLSNQEGQGQIMASEVLSDERVVFQRNLLQQQYVGTSTQKSQSQILKQLSSERRISQNGILKKFYVGLSSQEGQGPITPSEMSDERGIAQRNLLQQQNVGPSRQKSQGQMITKEDSSREKGIAKSKLLQQQDIRPPSQESQGQIVPTEGSYSEKEIAQRKQLQQQAVGTSIHKSQGEITPTEDLSQSKLLDKQKDQEQVKTPTDKPQASAVDVDIKSIDRNQSESQLSQKEPSGKQTATDTAESQPSTSDGPSNNEQTTSKTTETDTDTSVQKPSISDGFLKRRIKSSLSIGLGLLFESASFITTVPPMSSLIHAPRVFFSNRRLNRQVTPRTGSTDHLESPVEERLKPKWICEGNDSTESFFDS